MTLTLLVGMTACEDYVDFEASETFTIIADDYFKTADDYQSALVGTYDPLQWMYLNTLIGDIATNNTLCGGESATDVVGLQKIDDYTHDPDNDQLTAIWKYCYEGINRANYMKENEYKLDFGDKDNVYGQVHFLRAYYYFELVKFFGGVPLFVDKRLLAADSSTLSRASKEEVYAQIESDLLTAIGKLPNSQSVVGKIRKSTAQALLGKVYLFQDKFDEAANMLENVINVYSLEDDFSTIFLKGGENNAESVFEIQYTNEYKWYDWSYMPQGTEGNFGVIHNGPRGLQGEDLEFDSGWSFNVPTQELVDLYEVGDSRKEATILDIEAWATAKDATYGEGYEHTGYFNKKYIPRAGETSAQPELNYLTNYRVIRYSDVLLMAAEAHNRKNGADDNTARMYLNEVIERAYGDSSHNVDASVSGSDLTDLIWLERRKELALEGHHFFDLVRTGQAAVEIDGFTSGKHEVFPIPQQEIDISGLEQNNY